jgi:hypothetical protein
MFRWKFRSFAAIEENFISVVSTETETFWKKVPEIQKKKISSAIYRFENVNFFTFFPKKNIVLILNKFPIPIQIWCFRYFEE